jgi:EmrB/QacA subfamily drug resistance transporter
MKTLVAPGPVQLTGHPSAGWALAALSLCMLLASLGTSIANVGLPTLAQALGASFQQVQWVVLAYLLAITTVVVSVGRLGDLVGRRRLLLAGVFVFTAASLACGMATALWQLVAARALQGLGAATMMALAMALVGSTLPKARTGSAMGLLGAMSAMGTALGPTLGGLLIGAFGWPALFLVNLPFGLLSLLLVLRALPADPAAPTTGAVRFDHVGTLVLALTLAAYALAMTLGRGSFGLLNAGLLLAAGAGAALFAVVESKAAAPLVPLAMFRHRVLGAGFVASALVSTVVMASLVVGPFYLSGALALDAARIGLVMSCGPVVAALAGVPAGRLVDGIGVRRTALAGLAAMTVGCALLPVTASLFAVPGYIAALAVTTAGYALFQAANNTAVMDALGAGERGVVAGLLNLSRNLGLVTGASLMGAVFALGSSAASLGAARPEAVTSGLRATFAVATALILAAVALTLGARRQRASA